MFRPHQITHNGHEYVAISYCTVLHLIICCNLVLHLFFCPNPQLRSFTLLIVLGVSFDTLSSINSNYYPKVIALETFTIYDCVTNASDRYLCQPYVLLASAIFGGLLALTFSSVSLLLRKAFFS